MILWLLAGISALATCALIVITVAIVKALRDQRWSSVEVGVTTAGSPEGVFTHAAQRVAVAAEPRAVVAPQPPVPATTSLAGVAAAEPQVTAALQTQMAAATQDRVVAAPTDDRVAGTAQDGARQWSIAMPARATAPAGTTPPVDYVNDLLTTSVAEPATAPPREQSWEANRTAALPKVQSREPFVPPVVAEAPEEKDDFVPVAVLDIFLFDDNEDR